MHCFNILPQEILSYLRSQLERTFYTQQEKELQTQTISEKVTFSLFLLNIQ